MRRDSSRRAWARGGLREVRRLFTATLNRAVSDPLAGAQLVAEPAARLPPPSQSVSAAIVCVYCGRSAVAPYQAACSHVCCWCCWLKVINAKARCPRCGAECTRKKTLMRVGL